MSVPLPAAFLASMNESIDYEDMLEVSTCWSIPWYS